MMGEQEKQMSISDTWYDIAMAKDSYWHEVRTWIKEHIDEETFKPLFSQYGRPSVPPIYTFAAILVQLEMGYSDRELEGESRYDDRIKYAIGAPRNFLGIDAVTLHDHRKRFFESELGREMFAKTVGVAKESGLFSEENLGVVDTFMIDGAAQKQDTYTLIFCGTKRLLRFTAFYEIQKEAQEVLMRDDYDLDRNKPRIDWDDPDQKQELLESLVTDALALVEFVRSHDAFNEELEVLCDLLERVATQDVDIDDEGRVELVHGTCKDRVISVNDPQMRHGRKTSSQRTDGYKAEVMTGGELGSVVVGVEVDGANIEDGAHLDEVIKQSEEHDCSPDTLYGDSAYNDYEKQDEYEGIDFCTKVAPACNPHAEHTKDDFAIDVEAGTVTCRGGRVTAFEPELVLKERKGTIVRFQPGVCNSCACKEKCTTSEKGRTVTIHPYEDRMQQKKTYQKTDAFREEYAKRSNGERIIAHLVRHGARVARFFGKAKVKWQVLMAAINHNIKTTVRYVRRQGA